MKKLKYLPMIVFCAFIGAMCVLFFVLPKADYSSSEKRYLAEFPELNSETFFSGDFGAEFEKYLADHTAFRNFWVGMSSYYQLAIGNNGSTGIYKCKDGYLVNDPTETADYHKNLLIIDEFAENHPELQPAMILAPSTGYICADVLPLVHREYRDDELFDEAKNTLAHLDFVDVRSDFADAYASGTQIYYKTDHHWTTSGAYVAYSSLSKALGFTPNPDAAYTKTSYDGFYGTTYSSSCFWLNEPDTIEVWDNPANDADITVTITEGAEQTTSSDMFYYDHLEEDDKYPVFLDGNHPFERIINSANPDGEKLLIIKDSFAHSLTPFLADHYSEIVMVDMRYYKKSVSDLCAEEGFDRVLFIYSLDNLATDGDIRFLE